MTTLLLVLVFAVLLIVTYQLFSAKPGSDRRLEVARWRVRAATELAYAHDEISPALAGAIIERTRGLNDDDAVQTLEVAIEDVLALARQHRATEPDLAVIVIDTVRSEAGPSQLGR